MYNTNKGGNTLNESEILEPLHRCLRECLEMEKNGKMTYIKYTDDDVVAATLMFTHVLGNRLTHYLTDEKVGIGHATELSKHYAALVSELTRSMSGVDINNHYSGRE